jgi:16S rRNA (guanine(966)-N(2))-methyltransferase RsmD
MKILGGTLKGRNFYMPAAIRPTQDSLRAGIFDILGHDFSDLRFLDLFAGSGAVGLEAISRGAREAVFVEKDATNAGIIQENFELLKLGYPHPFHRVINMDAFAAIKALAKKNERFDVVFFDPPFELKLAKKILKHLVAYDILHAHSYVVGQFGRDDALPDDLEGRFKVLKERNYGSSQLVILEALEPKTT